MCNWFDSGSDTLNPHERPLRPTAPEQFRGAACCVMLRCRRSRASKNLYRQHSGGQRYRAGGSNRQGRQVDQQKWILPAGSCRRPDAATRHDDPMPTVPESARTSLAQKLTAQARTAWPWDGTGSPTRLIG
jgi:hypothetical protein